jgi:NAD(P)-dependent dehydrogenase (short-subunit alcohol dehydrogenase family)
MAQAEPVTVVVGVGPGLGGAVARRFAAAGHAVGLVARGKDKLAPVAEAIEAAGGRAVGVAADATSPESVAAAFAELRRELGPIDVLVYNAGAFTMGGIMDVTPEDFDGAWRANCAGAFLTSREVIPGMLERGRGTLLMTGATASLRGGARFSCLAVGKFGLRALAQSMARELGPRGIHVAHVIIDGQIDLPRSRAMFPDREPHTFLSPDAIAESYLQLHLQDRTAWTQELDLRPAVEKF